MKNSNQRSLRILGPLLCLLPLGLAATQNSKSGQKPDKVFSDRQFFETKQHAKASQTLIQRMQGCWKLVSIEADDYPGGGLDLLGYMLVSGPFISLEVQAYWDDTLEQPPADAFETFIGEAKSMGKGAMEVQVLMGSFMDRDRGNLEWYKSDRPERFAVELPDPATLILEWRGKRKMTFRRQRSRVQISRNFYGSSGNAARNNFYDDSNDPIEETPEPIEDDAVEEKIYRDDR